MVGRATWAPKQCTAIDDVCDMSLVWLDKHDDCHSPKHASLETCQSS